MSILHLDIETIRGPIDPAWEQEFPLPNPPGEPVADKRLKDPAKIEADLQAKREKAQAAYEEALRTRDEKIRERWEHTPLEVLEGEVLCVGIARDDAEPTVLWRPTERETLEELERGLVRYPTDSLCAYRGIHFDFRFIAGRALKYGLDSLARRMYQPKPYGTRSHIDPYLIWCGPERRARGRLVEVARFLGIEVKGTVDGALVPKLWHEVSVMAHDEPRRVEVETQIRDHVLEDVRVLREVHRRMDAAGWC